MKEVGKEEFREIYFRLGGAGWGREYWEKFYETPKKPGMKYLIEEPPSPQHTRMMIVEDYAVLEYRLFFMTEQAEEAFFDHPGKEA